MTSFVTTSVLVMLFGFHFSTGQHEIPEIVIGGLFPIHVPGEDGRCSDNFSSLGMNAWQAALYAIDQLKYENSPPVSLKSFDTCSNDRMTLNKAVKELAAGATNEVLIGIIGPAFNHEVDHIAVSLEIFGYPFISYSASSSRLQDKTKYSYFSRTVPSDVFQLQAIVALLEIFNWTYVSVAYTDGGMSGFDFLQAEAIKKGICFAHMEKLPLQYNNDSYKTIANRITSDPLAQVVLLLNEPPSLRPLVKEIRKQARPGPIQLITLWPIDDTWNYKVDKETNGDISVLTLVPAGEKNEDFVKYLQNLTPETNKVKDNPWFNKYFQARKKCSFNKTGEQRVCNRSENLYPAEYLNSPYNLHHTTFVIDSLNILAEAFAKTWKNARAINTGKHMNDMIDKINYTRPSKTVISLDNVQAAYNIFYSKSSQTSKVGKWQKGVLQLLPTWNEKLNAIVSVCSVPCGDNHVEQRIPDKPRCCWECIKSPLNAYVVNKTTWRTCPRGYLPDKIKKTCYELQPKYFSLGYYSTSRYMAAVLVFLSSLGAICVLAVSFVFVKYHQTPLVKASGRELCTMLLLGLFLSFLFPFIAIFKPCPPKCFFQFIFYSLPLTICYVAITVKNNRIFRIFNPERTLTNQLNFVRPRSQVFIASGLISFQVILLFALILLEFPRDQLLYPSSTMVVHVCKASGTQVLLSNVYNFILLIVCTYYGYKTRNVPQNFNEAKFIAFAMYGSCVTTLAFAVILAVKNLDPVSKLIVYCFHNMFLATILLICYFGSKVYIIFFKSHENVNHSSSRSKATPPCQNNSIGTQGRNDELLLPALNPSNKFGCNVSCSTQTDWLT